MGIGSVIQSGVDVAKQRPLATLTLLAFQSVAAVDQFQYEAAYNEPEAFSVGDVASDIMFGNILNFGPTFNQISRAMGPDEACANQGQIFNPTIEWANENDPTGLAGLPLLWTRFAHWSSIPGAEIGSLVYETYDTGMKLMYDPEEREAGICVGLE